MASLSLALLLFEFRSIVILLILAILVSAAIRPAVLLMVERLPVSRATATIIVYLAGTIFFIIFLLIPGDAVVTELQTIFNDIAATYESRFPIWMEGTALQQAIASELPPPDQLYESLVGPVFGQEVMGLTRGVLGLFGGAAVILVLSIYWTIDQARLERYWLSLLPADWRVQARRIWREVEVGVGAYFRSELIQSLAATVFLALVYGLIGLDFPFILAGLSAIAWLIPLVGAFFAILPLLAVGLLNGSLGLSILASLCTIVILSGLELFVEPKLFHRRQYNSTTTVLLMLIFVEDFGLVGLIMAPPIAAALQIFFNHWLKHTTTAVPKKPNVDVSLLKERYEKMLTKQEENGEELNPALENLTHRLEKLLKEAESFTAPP